MEYAHKLGDSKYATSCVASLGILRGSDRFDQTVLGTVSKSTDVPAREIKKRASKNIKVGEPY